MSKLKDLAGVPRNLDTGLRILLEGLREHVRSMTGMDGRGQAINLTEESVQGIVSDALAGFTPSVGSGGGGSTYVPDYTEPPTPSGVSVTAGLSYLHIETDSPAFSDGHGYERTIVYGTSWPTGDPAPTFSSAVKMHEFIGTVSSFPVQLNTRYAVWVKWLTQDAVLSATPAGGANGFVATTGKIGNADLGSLIVQAGNLAAGAVTAVKFDAAIEPITLYTSGSLPTTKSTSTIFYGGKLYRWSGTAYVASVPTSDLSGTVSDAQIAGMSASKVSGTLTDAQLAAISAAKITGQIIGTQITDGAVTTAKIFAGSITTSKIAADAVTSNEIAAGAVTATEIAAGAVTTAKLAAGAVTANEIAAGAVTAGKVAANAITATELAADAITAGKIAAGAVTASKIAANAIAVGSAAIQDGAIVNAMLGNATIDGAKIANAAISDAHITNLSGTKITANSIAADRMSVSNLAAITANMGAVTSGSFTVDAAGFVRGGQTAFNTGTGFWLGYAGGAYKFSLGSSSQGITWDGANLNINGGGTFSGDLAAATVGAGGVTVSSSGNIKGGQTAYDTGTGFWMGYSGATYKFSMKGSTGQGITFDGTDLLITGKLTASAVNAVDTINIADNAVTIPLSAQWVGEFFDTPGATQVVATASADFKGQPVIINATILVGYTGDATVVGAGVRIFRDGVNIVTSEKIKLVGERASMTYSIRDTPPSGSHTYGVGYSRLGGDSIFAASITVLGVKK